MKRESKPFIESVTVRGADAAIQAATNQSAQMVAYYRQKANRVALTKNARERGKGA